MRLLSRVSPGPGILLREQKSPTRQLGADGMALSREERGPLRHGRVAWLTAFQPITVAGPRPIHTAFPRFPCLQIEVSVYAGVAGVSNARLQKTPCGSAILPVGL